MALDFATIVPKFDEILNSRGLSYGLGEKGGAVCIEAAICEALGLPHGDDPGCVAEVVRGFKIRLNDSNWSTPMARAAGLRDLGIAQLGTRGMLDNKAFAAPLVKYGIQVLAPKALRGHVNDAEFAAALEQCAETGGKDAIWRLYYALQNIGLYPAETCKRMVVSLSNAADCLGDYYDIGRAAAWVAKAADDTQYLSGCDVDSYLRLVADYALQVLRDLKTPGALYLDSLSNSRSNQCS